MKQRLITHIDEEVVGEPGKHRATHGTKEGHPEPVVVSVAGSTYDIAQTYFIYLMNILFVHRLRFGYATRAKKKKRNALQNKYQFNDLKILQEVKKSLQNICQFQ